jgi:hypothetical protein
MTTCSLPSGWPITTPKCMSAACCVLCGNVCWHLSECRKLAANAVAAGQSGLNIAVAISQGPFLCGTSGGKPGVHTSCRWYVPCLDVASCPGCRMGHAVDAMADCMSLLHARSSPSIKCTWQLPVERNLLAGGQPWIGCSTSTTAASCIALLKDRRCSSAPPGRSVPCASPASLHACRLHATDTR